MRDARQLIRDDEGSVLIAVVGIMVVMTVLVIGAFGMSSDSLFQTRRDRARAQALAVAEAGLEQVMWRIKVGQPPTSTVIYVDVPSMGRATIETSRTSGTNWHLVATGETSAVPGVTRTVSTDVLAMSIWDMFFATGVEPAANGRINGSGYFKGSMYMRGDWPPTNGSANFEGGPYFVKNGNVDFDQPGFGDAEMGTEGQVELYCDGSVNMTDINAKVYTSVPDIPMPKQRGPELAVNRNLALSESTDGLQGAMGTGYMSNTEGRQSGVATGIPAPLSPPYTDVVYPIPKDSLGNDIPRHYKVIDNDSVTNTSVAAVYIGKDADGDWLPSFGRPYDPVLGHSSDDFSWDATSHVLTVQGTVFIDAAHLYITDVKYAGKGTIITPGDVHIEGLWQPRCFDDAPYNLDAEPTRTERIMANLEHPEGYPRKHAVGVSSSSRIYEHSDLGVGPFYAGISWEMDLAGTGSGDKYFGTIVSPEITMAHIAHVEVTPLGNDVPPSMPGGGGQIVAIAGWHEGRN